MLFGLVLWWDCTLSLVSLHSYILYGNILIILYIHAGVEVSVEEIEKTVNEVFEERKNEILEQRYRTNG